MKKIHIITIVMAYLAVFAFTQLFAQTNPPHFTAEIVSTNPDSQKIGWSNAVGTVVPDGKTLVVSNGVLTTPPPSVTSEVLPLFTDIGQRFPWVLHLVTIMGTARIMAKWFNGKIQSAFSAKVADFVPTVGGTHDQIVRNLLNSKVYTTAQFVLDLVLSIKLPTEDAYLKQLHLQDTPVEGTQYAQSAVLKATEPIDYEAFGARLKDSIVRELLVQIPLIKPLDVIKGPDVTLKSTEPIDSAAISRSIRDAVVSELATQKRAGGLLSGSTTDVKVDVQTSPKVVGLSDSEKAEFKEKGILSLEPKPLASVDTGGTIVN